MISFDLVHCRLSGSEDSDLCGPGSPYGARDGGGPDGSGNFYNVQSPGSTCSTNTNFDQEHSNTGFPLAQPNSSSDNPFSSFNQSSVNNRLTHVNSL